MDECKEREESGSEWQKLPPFLCEKALQAAVQKELETKGLCALGNGPLAGKPPRPPSRGSAGSGGQCFGVSLTAPQPQLLLESADGCGQGVWLPRVFVECVRSLRGNVHCPGLFRKAGSVTRQRAIRTSLESGQGLSSTNIHDVANILKQYLRELPSPLVPSPLSPVLQEVWSRVEGRERVELVMSVLLQSPPAHVQMLRELCLLLHSVAQAESYSLMGSHSLAVVMTPNIIPTHHSDPLLLDTALRTHTGIVQLLIDHAHIIGLAPPHLINIANQIAKENDDLTSRSDDSLEGRLDEIKEEGKRRRGSVTDRVLGWGTKLMSTIGSVSRDLGGGTRDQDHTHSPVHLGNPGARSEQCLFAPSLPTKTPHQTPHPLPTKTPHSHKRRRSFLGKRRHTDGRHANRQKSMFSNPFRGVCGEFLRQGPTRGSERRFPWLQGNGPSTPGPNVQLVRFGSRPSSQTGGSEQDGSSPTTNTDCPVLTNGPALSPVIGNRSLLASVSEESLPPAGGGEGGGGDTKVKVPQTYAVGRTHSGKRMRCEVDGGGGGGGEEGCAVKRRHTLYTSKSQEGYAHLGGIRASKSETTMRLDSDPRITTGFSFSRPTPPCGTPREPMAVPMVTDEVSTVTEPSVSNRPFTFSNPRKYPAKQCVVANSNITAQECVKTVTSSDRVFGVSPIPYLPEIPPQPLATQQSSSFCAPLTPAPRGPPLPRQLNEGFLLTPFPLPPASSPSPNLLEKISSELVERHKYSLATPLATPTLLSTNEVATVNSSYQQAIYSQSELGDLLPHVKPGPLEFNASIERDEDMLEGSKVMQEVSFSFELNSNSHHGNKRHTPPRPPLSQLPSTPWPAASILQLKPPKAPLQRKFALTPLLLQGPRFTDLSSPFVTIDRPGKKTPRVTRRAQMYVIPSSSCDNGDKENVCGGDDGREWIV